MKLPYDGRSLSTFKRDTSRITKHLKKTREPLVLTVRGKAEFIVQDAESYWKLLETINRLEAIEGIRRGLESMKAGRGRPVEIAFKELFAKLGIPEEE